MILLKLFIEFIKIGSFSFGGGLATLPHIYDLAEKTNWFSANDVTNMITISQATPGPLACNMATYVGFKLNGFLGAFIATLSFILPAILFMSIMCKLLNKIKGNSKVDFILKIIRAVALATIIDGSLTIFKIAFLNNVSEISGLNSIINNIQYKSIILAIFLYCITKKFKISTLNAMAISLVIGIVFKF